MPATAEADTNRALARLYSRAAVRPLLAALCDIEHEIGASLLAGLDHHVAHTRLAWWREECARCAQGRATHPLTRELGAGLAPAALPVLAGLAGLVDTAEWDLARATFATRRELTGYCERWSAAIVELLARCTLPEAAAAPARALGRTLRELELLLALAAEARAGRIRLPLDELERVQVTPEELARPPWPPALASLVRERHRELRAALAAGVEALGPAERAALRGVIVWASLAAAHSLRAARALPHARETGYLFDGWRAWRAAHRADAGRSLRAG